VTLTGLPALDSSPPDRLGRRALLVALAMGLGGVCWVVADAASAAPLASLVPPAPPTASIIPAAWSLDPAGWHGLAGLPHRLAGARWAVIIAALLLVAGSSLAVVHPGAFQRPAAYQLPAARAAIAVISALLIGLAMPATLLLLEGQIGTTTAFDATGAIRVGLGVVVFCACLWTLAGPDVWHPRALLRFAHGGIAGFGIFGAFALAVVLVAPFMRVVEAGAVAAAIRDAGHATPNATWSTLLAHRLLVQGFAFALAGAVAVMAGPQSVGRDPRITAAGAASLLLAVLLLAGWRAHRAARAILAEVEPDVVADLGLRTTGGVRAIALLSGGGRLAVPLRTGSHDPDAVRLDRECRTADGPMPAPTDANVERVERALGALAGEVSVRSSRTLACLVALRTARFEPDQARAALFADRLTARLPVATLAEAARGLLDPQIGVGLATFRSALADTTRFAGPPDLRAHLLRPQTGSDLGDAVVEGTLTTDRPSGWRVALVRGPDSTQAGSERLYAPVSEDQVLRYMAAAVSPDERGRFAFTGVGGGPWQLALLAPHGLSASGLTALSVRGDPGQFVVRAAERRDLGTIQLGH
jgi:hypothetical protein